MADRRPTQTSDLLRLVPGVTVMRSRFGGSVATSWRRGRPCPMKVVVDGYPADLATESFDDWVPPRGVLGMEVCPGGMGASVEHRGPDAVCGIVMVWTR